MIADPEPIEDAILAKRKRSAGTGYSHAPKLSDLLEMQRRMCRIPLKQGELFVGRAPRGRRQTFVQMPETGQRPRFRQLDSLVESLPGIGRILP